jgi:Raf kinase inhibitor-like YbhB/YbcL family protein
MFKFMKKRIYFPIIVVSFAWIIFSANMLMTKNNRIMELHSKRFQNEALIPARHTCDGINVSPDLTWSGFPRTTVTFALVCNDPDAPSGNWIHWVLFNIPATVNHLPENFTFRGDKSGETRSGKNDAGKLDYYGPCPPSGIHRYYFRVYALDIRLAAKEGISARELNKLMEGHIIGTGELMGRYQRK